MLDLRRLRVFREVARRGSIAAAADALSLTPSAVSQQLAALERECAVALVERGPSSIRLTAAGTALVDHADDILGRAAAVETDLRRLGELEIETLRVGGFGTAASTLLPQAMADFHASHPDVELIAVEAEPEVSLKQLQVGELDLALVYDYAFARQRTASNVRLVPLLDDPVRVVIPADHPLAERPLVAIGDLCHETWVAPTGATACASLLERTCREAGFEARISFRTDDYGAACELVASGVAVALVPRLAVRDPSGPIVSRPLAEPPPVRRILAAHRVGSEHTAGIAGLLRALERAASVIRDASSPGPAASAL